MGVSLFFLLLSLGMILLAAEGFTNGVEVVGRRLSFSQAVVGSILAAVGTALPETILPLVAIFSHAGGSSKEIGVGAILGAPFMLATIGFFLIGGSAWAASCRAGRQPEVRADRGTLKRDLIFFLGMYGSAVFLPILFPRIPVWPLAILLGAGYILYVFQTIAGESAPLEHFEPLHIVKFPEKLGWIEKKEASLRWSLLQIAISLGVMVFGAQIFVRHLEVVSVGWGMDPLLFALLVAPIATELPEKFNSVTWTLKGKDTLAVGNMTGAMVFQSTFPVSVGLLFTPWKVEGMALISAVLALFSAGALLYVTLTRPRISPWVMMLGGILYAVYAAVVIGMK
ncbi:MAG: sodium:calcium antiporter [Candidatus Omnitrophota bacterium]